MTLTLNVQLLQLYHLAGLMKNGASVLQLIKVKNIVNSRYLCDLHKLAMHTELANTKLLFSGEILR